MPEAVRLPIGAHLVPPPALELAGIVYADEALRTQFGLPLRRGGT